MQLVIPFAAPLPPAGTEALRALRLPQIERIVRSRAVAHRDDGEPTSLSPPHERAVARAFGWRGDDGRLPFAAHAARGDGIDVGDLAWGLLTPVHWQLGSDHVGLADPASLQLADAESRALFDAVAPLAASAGFVAAYGAPLRWYVAHDSLRELPCASLDRVIGRSVDEWLDAGGRGTPVRRLQNEMQMLLHAQPLNDARESRSLPPVNSVWLSGCGVAQPVPHDAGVRVDARLRAPALADDWAAWAQAWSALDATLDTDAALTLCGERTAVTLAPVSRGWFARWRARGSAVELLESL